VGEKETENKNSFKKNDREKGNTLTLWRNTRDPGPRSEKSPPARGRVFGGTETIIEKKKTGLESLSGEKEEKRGSKISNKERSSREKKKKRRWNPSKSGPGNLDHGER